VFIKRIKWRGKSTRGGFLASRPKRVLIMYGARSKAGRGVRAFIVRNDLDQQGVVSNP